MNKITKLLILVFSVMLLTACQSKYQKEVDLTPEEEEAIHSEIQVIKNVIENEEEKNKDAGIMAHVNLARQYQKLGDLGEAISIYKKMIKRDLVSSTVYHNLGRLYEDVKEWELAIEQYQLLVDEFFMPRYLYDITWVHIKTEDRKSAEKYFNDWQRTLNTTDLHTQEAIKKLRAKEKALK